MVIERRNTSKNIISHLTDNIKNYSLDAVMRVLESLIKDEKYVQKGIVLKSDLRLNVPWNEISDIKAEDGIISLFCNRFGVGNMQSCLPNSYIEDFIISRDKGFVEFLNVFNNRLLNLSYETSKNYSVALQNKSLIFSRYSEILKSLSGIGTAKDPLYIPIMKNAILFWRKPRSRVGLKYMLESSLDYDVDIENFVGGWSSIAKSSLTVLGKTNHSLGRNTIAGSRLWNQLERVRFTIKSIKFDDLKHFVQDFQYLRIICFILKKYFNFYKQYSIRLHINMKEIQPSKLDGKSMIGTSCWILSTKEYNNEVRIWDSRIKMAQDMNLGL